MLGSQVVTGLEEWSSHLHTHQMKREREIKCCVRYLKYLITKAHCKILHPHRKGDFLEMPSLIQSKAEVAALLSPNQKAGSLSQRLIL